jgi:hypothetical protein
MALTGSFDDVSFAELLQMLNLGRKAGTLNVSCGPRQASLHLRDGEVVHAVMKELSGSEVVYRLLGWSRGRFEFTTALVNITRTIEQSTENLIFEGLKRMDEWRQIELELGDSQGVLRVRARAAELAADLEPETRALLPLVDARRCIADIVRESGLEPYEGLLRINELLSVGAVERWEPPDATRSAAGDSEAKIEFGHYLRHKPRERGPDELVIKARATIGAEEHVPEQLSGEETVLAAAEAMLSA